MDRRMYGRMDGISPHSTGGRPLPGSLPKKLSHQTRAVHVVCKLFWVVEVDFESDKWRESFRSSEDTRLSLFLLLSYGESRFRRVSECEGAHSQRANHVPALFQLFFRRSASSARATVVQDLSHWGMGRYGLRFLYDTFLERDVRDFGSRTILISKV